MLFSRAKLNCTTHYALQLPHIPFNKIARYTFISIRQQFTWWFLQDCTLYTNNTAPYIFIQSRLHGSITLLCTWERICLAISQVYRTAWATYSLQQNYISNFNKTAPTICIEGWPMCTLFPICKSATVTFISETPYITINFHYQQDNSFHIFLYI